MLTNAKVLRFLKQKKANKQEYQKLSKQSKKIRNRLEKLNEKIEYADLVSEVYKGICLRGDTNGNDHVNNLNLVGAIFAVADDANHYAEFWRNVNDKSEWRIKLHSRKDYWKNWEQKQYITYLTREEALIACKEWVAFGKMVIKQG